MTTPAVMALLTAPQLLAGGSKCKSSRANILGILRFVGLLIPRRGGGSRASETTAGDLLTRTLKGSERIIMAVGFDMKTEIGKLATRIVEPASAKVPAHDIEAVVGKIRGAFAQLNTKRPTADEDFEAMAVTILEPVNAKLDETSFARIVDRLRGAMVGFCQRDEVKAQPDAEPWGLQEAGQCETLDLRQNEHSEPANAEPWWSTSEQAMLLLILLWLCTEGHYAA
jgi:hypothetical protein